MRVRNLFDISFVEDKELRKSLSLVILGVCFGIIFFNVTQGAPIAGFAKELGFGDLLYGVMLAMPVLGGAIQLFASYVLEKTRKRKLLFFLGGFIQRLPWLLVVILPFFVHDKNVLFSSIVFLLSITAIGSAFINVSFMSWMGDLVPIEIRGRFFSHRSMLATFVSLISGLLIGAFLDRFSDLYGFAVVFIFAVILGIFDILCFIWVYDPPMRGNDFSNVNFAKLFKESITHPKFSHFLLFAVLWNFALNISAPYFNLYMIKYLKMSYFDIALYVQIISNVTTILSVRILGRLIDRFGNKPVLQISTFIVSFLPYIWCFTTPNNWLLFVILVQIFAGVFWPGIDLSFNNLALGLSPNENRSFYIAVLNLFVGIINAISFILGGYIIEYVAPSIVNFINSLLHIHLVEYHLIFILSGMLRFTFLRIFIPKISEERSKPVEELTNHIVRRIRKRTP
ncbi:MFS transporter [Dictyoglomus turgidum]|uniref:Major facilitator superfamily MFS_1 n=1 Tax=Dictyoglomus turgidum (strain DSM 6724 / Z-1310) TaxID=515635 RepID=B8E0L5_DICTD|nr:MFS transporter [Dictyoglomus turgidum]ACK43035.1 major facilitator superfamily MFS_1 [Dictyoglomus turgidum DSM 6724]